MVHIGDETLRSRLQEFEMTPSGQLTIEQFDRLDFDTECDPPAFLRAREGFYIIVYENNQYYKLIHRRICIKVIAKTKGRMGKRF